MLLIKNDKIHISNGLNKKKSGLAWKAYVMQVSRVLQLCAIIISNWFHVPNRIRNWSWCECKSSMERWQHFSSFFFGVEWEIGTANQKPRKKKDSFNDVKWILRADLWLFFFLFLSLLLSMFCCYDFVENKRNCYCSSTSVT